MKGPLDMLSNLLFEPKTRNNYWKVCESDGNKKYQLVDEAGIKRDIESAVTRLGIKEGEYKVEGIGLFGSVYKFRKMKTFWFGRPSDVDIYVHMAKVERSLSSMVQEEIKTTLEPRFGVKVQCLVYDHHPFDHHDITGELPGLDRIHTLYVGNNS